MSLGAVTTTGASVSEVVNTAVVLIIRLQLSVALNTTVIGTVQPGGKLTGALFVTDLMPDGSCTLNAAI